MYTFWALAWYGAVLLFVYRLVRILESERFFHRHAHDNALIDTFVSIIIPARNEESNIERVVRSLAVQSLEARHYEIIIVNDNSTDDTATIAQALSREFTHVRLINAPLLPQGWSGKNHACHIGSLEAKGDYLLFIDADTQAGISLLETTLRFARNRAIDLLSMSPMQEMISVGEKLLLPAIFLGVAGTIRLDKINTSRFSDALANGQFLMFSRSCYTKIGGHEAIKNQLCDDVTFAHVVKQKGMRLHFGLLKRHEFSARMYDSFGSAWKGFGKNLSDILGIRGYGHALRNVGYFLFLMMGWVAAPWMLYNGSIGEWASWVWAVAAITLLSIVTVAAREFRIGVLYVLFLPWAYGLYAVLLLRSLRLRTQKGAREWRGRFY
ncbi:MAG: hypothetical protein KU37_09890 [Sulfuricurvum sp. PC08-66]|nr:MAG: hypothetical protein KU37_09890 [Sulfuricurvum sp. PC08-66]